MRGDRQGPPMAAIRCSPGQSRRIDESPAQGMLGAVDHVPGTAPVGLRLDVALLRQGYEVQRSVVASALDVPEGCSVAEGTELIERAEDLLDLAPRQRVDVPAIGQDDRASLWEGDDGDA